MKPLKVALAAACAVVVGWVFTAAADIPASAYIQDGLVAQWDGIENAGAGQPHDATLAEWKDASGTHSFVFNANSGITVEDSALVFPGSQAGYATLSAADTDATFEAAKNGTCEVVVLSDANTVANMALQSSAQSGICLFARARSSAAAEAEILTTTGASDASKRTPVLCNLSSAITTMATTYSSALADDTWANGELLKKSGTGGYGGSPNDKTYLGHRASLASGQSFKGRVYAIRLYSRPLTESEIAINAAVDKVRFGGADPAGLTWPDGYRYNAERQRVEAFISVSTDFTGAKVSLNGCEPALSASDWVAVGSDVTVEFSPGVGIFDKWVGLVDTTVDATQTTVTFKAVPMNLTTGHKTVSWKHNVSGSTRYWDDVENWKDSDGVARLPAAEDIVSIGNITVYPYGAEKIYVTNALPKFKSLFVGYGRTVYLNWGWTNKLEVGEITLTGTVNNNNGHQSNMTCDGFTNGAKTNRLWIVANKLRLSNSASILSATGGLKGGYGPGWEEVAAASRSGAGAHGGLGATGTCKTYGSITEPVLPGTGAAGSSSGGGGGAIRLEVKEIELPGGIISASGSYNAYGQGNGSGGSIWITCDTITGTGTVTANGGGAEAATNPDGPAGGGGRIAIYYDAEKQAAADSQVVFSARGGVGRNPVTLSHYNYSGGSGTLYFSDDLFLRRPTMMLSGCIYYGPDVTPLTGLSGTSRTLEKTYLEIADDNAAIDFSGDLAFVGANAKGCGIRLTGANPRVSIGGNLTIKGAELRLTKGGTVDIGGNLVMADGVNGYRSAEMYFRAAPTNGTEAAGYVSYLNVAGDWTMGSNALAKVLCNASCGSYVALRAKNFFLHETASLDAAAAGWTSSTAPGRGSASSYGASHGGLGATTYGGYDKVTKLYGNRKHPTLPGSPGYGSYTTTGGGVINLQTVGKMDLNGSLTANGSNNDGWSSAASGGSIFLKAGKISGSTNCTITAKGGSSTVTHGNGAGGGGRIAIWYYASDFDDVNPTNVFSVSVAGGAGLAATVSDKKDGLPGSIYIHQIPGLMIFVR